MLIRHHYLKPGQLGTLCHHSMHNTTVQAADLKHQDSNCCAGSLSGLTLTGLPQLQHLRVTQQLPRSEPSVTVKCKALRLPYSLLSFRLTVSTPSLDFGEQLSALASLPQLESVGLHGPLLEKIPVLPTTVTRYRPPAGNEAVDCGYHSHCDHCHHCVCLHHDYLDPLFS